MIIKVILADDHHLVREGLRSVIEKKGEHIEVIGEAQNGKDVLAMAKKNPADVYVLDITMPVLNGIATTERLIKMDAKSKVIILSIHDNRIFVEKAIQSGARGYITKESAVEEIIRAIHEVYQGRFVLSPSISKFIVNGFLKEMNHQRSGESGLKLTPREKEILQLIAEGIDCKETARRLGLSLNTVQVHKKNVMRKLDLHRQVDLVRYAIKEGISKL